MRVSSYGKLVFIGVVWDDLHVRNLGETGTVVLDQELAIVGPSFDIDCKRLFPVLIDHLNP